MVRVGEGIKPRRHPRTRPPIPSHSPNRHTLHRWAWLLLGLLLLCCFLCCFWWLCVYRPRRRRRGKEADAADEIEVEDLGVDRTVVPTAGRMMRSITGASPAGRGLAKLDSARGSVNAGDVILSNVDDVRISTRYTSTHVKPAPPPGAPPNFKEEDNGELGVRVV